jgi:hypothetical protein
MITVKDMWIRLQEMFHQPTDFERWLANKNLTSAADIEHYIRQWNHQQFRNIY